MNRREFITFSAARLRRGRSPRAHSSRRCVSSNRMQATESILFDVVTELETNDLLIAISASFTINRARKMRPRSSGSPTS